MIDVLFPDEIVMMLFLYVFPVLFGVCLIALIGSYLLMPQTAKTIFWARFKKNITLLFNFFESGTVQLEVKKNLSQGVGEGKNKDFTFFPRQQRIEQMKDDSGKEIFSSKESKEYNDVVTKKFFMDGKPAVLQYSGIKQALNPKTLALIQEIDEAKAEGTKEQKGKLVKAKLFIKLLKPSILNRVLPGNYSGDQVGEVVQDAIEYGKTLASQAPVNLYIMMMLILAALCFVLGMVFGPSIMGMAPAP